MRLMKTVTMIVLFAIFALLASCGESGQPLHERLNGTWVNDLVTATFDFPNGKYTAVALGKTNTRPLKILEEKANYLIFETDEYKATVQLHENGDVLITREGGLPLMFKRQKD